MIIGIPKEVFPGETRVALVPSVVKDLTRAGHQVIIEKGAGLSALFADALYEGSGARLAGSAAAIYSEADIVFKVMPPTTNKTAGTSEADALKQGSMFIGFLSPLTSPLLIRSLMSNRITSFSMEFIPRITRAQSMDALSSMATVAGYKSVLLAAEKLPKMFPLLMTAAGTISPANVLVLGVGVAGLQAIATAKRLGARVSAFDPRPAVREQVKSLGAAFIEMELPEDAETAGGYAKEQSDEFIKKEMEAIGGQLPRADVVICTAQIFGKRAPILMTKEMVESMRAGTVIVDLAAEQGGNCALTVAGKTVEHNGVQIIGAVNLPSRLPTDASQMYSKNVANLFTHLVKENGVINFDDEIARGCCITHDGAVKNEMVRKSLEGSQ